MTEARTPTRGPEASRRRFLTRLGAMLGGLGAAVLARRVEPPAPIPREIPRELPLKEADFYRPHDLAG